MKTLAPHLHQFLGLLTNGDLGPYTMYTSQRNRLVVFQKTWPKDPATYHQTLHRNRWRHAALRWRALPQSLRDDWEQLSKRAYCSVTGYNLFIYYITGKGTAVIQTIERQTKINVIDRTGPPVPFRT